MSRKFSAKGFFKYFKKLYWTLSGKAITPFENVIHHERLLSCGLNYHQETFIAFSKITYM